MDDITLQDHSRITREKGIFLDNLIENLSNESSVISFMNASKQYTNCMCHSTKMHDFFSVVNVLQKKGFMFPVEGD